jgi:hypothetical protein
MTPVKWTFSGSITGGPALSATDTLDATAYDRASVDIDNDGNWVTVELAPAVPDTLLLLIIKADPLSDQVTFKVNEAAGTELRLNRPQVFSGAAGLLSANPVERLLFKNAGAATVNVDITMARYATARPAPSGAADGGGGGSQGEAGTDAAAEAPVPEPPAPASTATEESASEGGTGTTGTAERASESEAGTNGDTNTSSGATA